MYKEILYDRVIDVTLYRRAKRIDALHAVHSSEGYTESTVGGKRVFSSLGSKILTSETPDVRAQLQRGEIISGRKPVTSRIEFYEGNTRRVYAGIKRLDGGAIQEVYKEIKAVGMTYTYRTLDEMKRGLRPNGSMLATGDRCHVIQDGSDWNVYREGSESDLLTENTILVDTLTLNIPCTDYSVKPDVMFSIKLLPGQNCYGATLKIKNLNLGSIDIRSWDKMIVTAGYRDGTKATYTCPIFSSYIESPNPDGVTVFEGLTVGSAENNLTDHLITFHFLQEQMMLKDLISGVAQGIMEDIVVANSVSDDIMTRIITVEKRTVYAQNGVAVLNWLRDTVNAFVQEITAGQSTTYLQLSGNTLSVMIINGPSKQVELVKNIINLDSVSGASFSGTALTVTAPWNPALNPGDLFYMPPEFINGSMLPNVLSIRDYRNEDNLYRVLTMNIDFATVSDSNRMTILAVPAQWAGELPDELSTNVGDAEYAAALSEWYKTDNTREYNVGKEGEQEVADQRVTKKKAKTPEEVVKDTFEKNSNILGKWDTWQTIDLKSAPYISCLSMASQYYVYDMPGGPSLEKGKKGINNEGCYYETNSWLKEQGLTLAVKNQQDEGISALMLWIPLIALGTYWKREYDNNHGISNDWAKIKLENINFLDFSTGSSLYVPTFPTEGWRASRNRLMAFRDIWKDFYNTFKEGWPDFDSYVKQWRAMYYYLGGTGELN